jgi:hypothetical protein
MHRITAILRVCVVEYYYYYVTRFDVSVLAYAIAKTQSLPAVVKSVGLILIPRVDLSIQAILPSEAGKFSTGSVTVGNYC